MKSNFENLPTQVDYLLVEVLNIKEILLQRIEKSEEVPKYLDIEQALLYLKKQGYSMSKSKLYKLTSQGNIPCHKSEGRVYFTPQLLCDWVDSQVVGNDYIDRSHISQPVQTIIKSILKQKK
ncbi:helix-turn-helix domain-containing protein [Bacteroides sp.]|uniref:helix-turn-helix domain-containing protein n=1 Tax=Bacteroides sp. TaxID=29523 RepID=UPI0025BBFA32|nr:helix-turn-helix domain-containing protein [Bacteroides sp.]